MFDLDGYLGVEKDLPEQLASAPIEERYFQWNICKRYFYEVEECFQRQNIDDPYARLFRLKTKRFQNVYKKLLEYRLHMDNILKNLIIFERENLIQHYSITYQNYAKLENKDHMIQQNYPNPNEFKDKLNL